MVELGSTRHLPSGTMPAHAVPLGALGGIPTPFEPPVRAASGTELRTGTCHGVEELDEAAVFGGLSAHGPKSNKKAAGRVAAARKRHPAQTIDVGAI